jgi:hypothetical protein
MEEKREVSKQCKGKNVHRPHGPEQRRIRRTPEYTYRAGRKAEVYYGGTLVHLVGEKSDTCSCNVTITRLALLATPHGTDGMLRTTASSATPLGLPLRTADI